jgi:predicted outer membrane protein
MVRRLLAGALVCGVIACGGDDRVDNTNTAPTAAETDARTAALLAPVRAVSVLETELAGRAAQRAERESVRRYALIVGTDHRAVVLMLDSMASADRTQLQPTPAARELEEGVRTAHAGLDSLSGFAYDLGFIRAQIEAHRQLIDRIDQELIPGMGGPGPRRTLLQDVRMMVDAHLTRARQLLALLLESQPAGSVPRPVPRVAPDTGGRPVRVDTVARAR